MIYSHFELHLGFGSTQVDEINSAIRIHVVDPTQPIPCLLMHWRLQEPVHHQVWYRPHKAGIFGCLHLGQRPMTYLMTLSDWTMSCQPWPPRARYGQ